MYMYRLAFDHSSQVRMHWNMEYSYKKLRFIHAEECKISHHCGLCTVLLYSECLTSPNPYNFLCKRKGAPKYVYSSLSSYITLEFCVWTYFIDLFLQIFLKVYNSSFSTKCKCTHELNWGCMRGFFHLDFSEWVLVRNVGCWTVGLL